MRERLKDLIRQSKMFQDYENDVEGLCDEMESLREEYIELDEAYKSSKTKDNYIALTMSYMHCHFAYVLSTMLLEVTQDDVTRLSELSDDFKILLDANDSAIYFVEDDRDLITVGQLVRMSLYYKGDGTEPGADEQPLELSKFSQNRVFSQNLDSGKLRKHLRSTGCWFLLK